MSASGFSSIRQRSWLHRPVHYDRIPVRSSKATVPLELALLALAMAMFAFTVI